MILKPASRQVSCVVIHDDTSWDEKIFMFDFDRTTSKASCITKGGDDTSWDARSSRSIWNTIEDMQNRTLPTISKEKIPPSFPNNEYDFKNLLYVMRRVSPSMQGGDDTSWEKIFGVRFR
ncbi:hypothetical protein CEXT_232881 [Caerostris extrusa]|uniref:Uncharacterized protein n=1 Tax=Caerostris extrusa TaxID=172846 RepID=A0AAV4XGW6_CAEEX|nr:hypothetical protein CEXT_232881 [Caerostris extrusa]